MVTIQRVVVWGASVSLATLATASPAMAQEISQEDAAQNQSADPPPAPDATA